MRGGEKINKMYLQKEGEDFIVLVDDLDALYKWQSGDTTVPLVDIVNGFKVFTTHKQGAQGVLNSASNAALDAAFGTDKVEDIIKVILKEGSVQTTGTQSREGNTNESIGSMGSHR